jgi:hypothetical protein
MTDVAKTTLDVERLLWSDSITAHRVKLALELAYTLGVQDTLAKRTEELRLQVEQLDARAAERAMAGPGRSDQLGNVQGAMP